MTRHNTVFSRRFSPVTAPAEHGPRRASPLLIPALPCVFLSFLIALCLLVGGCEEDAVSPPAEDSTPPAAANDFSTSARTDSSITLVWTAPGDDGDVGKATGYSIRYALAPITNETWETAFHVISPPLPDSAGTAESLRVEGLTEETVYSFALKSFDDGQNWSELSNVVTDTTTSGYSPPQDSIPPAAVDDLAVVSVFGTSISLQWTAPGDDGSTGVAARYSIRHATEFLTEENWETAVAFSDPPVPDTAGTVQSAGVSGLLDRTKYYFAMKTVDEAWNGSGLSNVVSATTRAEPPPHGVWKSLGVGTTGPVYSLVSYGEDLIAAGEFPQAGPENVSNIARWTGGAWHALGRGTNRQVLCLHVFGDELIAGGKFSTAGDSAIRLIAGWDGESWSQLGSGLEGSGRDFVRALASFDDCLVVGGNLNPPGGDKLLCWDGAGWSAFGTGVGAAIQTFAKHDGGLAASGSFGSEKDHVSLWDGNDWIPLNTGLSGSTDVVHALLSYEGDLVVGGDFAEIGGVPANNIARWDGETWHPFGSGTNGPVFCLEVLDRDLVAAGAFSEAGYFFVGNIARWNGEEWFEMGFGTNGPIHDLELFRGGLIVGGDFFEAGSVVTNHIARWEDRASR